MLGWIGDVERATLDNDTFRTVLFTGLSKYDGVKTRLLKARELGLPEGDVSTLEGSR